MDDEEQRRMRDDVRSQTVVRNVEDALWRYNEDHEETLSVYDVIGMVLEGLIAEGMCPACIAESVQIAFERAGVDPDEHIREGDGDRPTMNRPDGDVFH
jgi:hypothetical protein